MSTLSWLHVYGLLAPVLVVGLALLTVKLTRWQDRRDRRRRSQETATAHRR